jgi:hypothetical protein
LYRGDTEPGALLSEQCQVDLVQAADQEAGACGEGAPRVGGGTAGHG